MIIDTRMSEELGRYLDLAVAATRLTAGNMANVDTPGYQAMGIDFDAEMRKALAQPATPAAPQATHERGLVSRPDGNNVSMDRESMNLAEAQLRFRTGVALLRTQQQMLLDAIHADAK